MEWTKEQQAENRKAWTAALRSGEYKQGVALLRRPDETYCCLGVACELAVKAGVIPPFRDRDHADGDAYGEGYLHHVSEFSGKTIYANGNLPDGVVAWLGLTTGWGGLAEVIEYKSAGDGETRKASSLVDLNDDGEYTFEQIADVIDAGKVEVV